jgi:hypothetical protein
MAPPGTYAYWVRKATRKLSSSDFGSWIGRDPDGIFNPQKDKFDKTYWKSELDTTGNDGKILKLNGKPPAVAIDAILDRIDQWRFDCDHTVQVANLYATRMILGADRFNLLAGAGMELRPRGSTGLKTVLHFGRDKPTEQWRAVTQFDNTKIAAQDPTHLNVQVGSPFTYAGSPLPDTTEQLVDKALPGSRVRWTDGLAILSAPFRHENCVKLGYDLYAAGGLSAVFTKNEFTRDRLEAKFTTTPQVNQIFIDEIEVFETNPQ